MKHVSLFSAAAISLSIASSAVAQTELSANKDKAAPLTLAYGNQTLSVSGIYKHKNQAKPTDLMINRENPAFRVDYHRPGGSKGFFVIDPVDCSIKFYDTAGGLRGATPAGC